VTRLFRKGHAIPEPTSSDKLPFPVGEVFWCHLISGRGETLGNPFGLRGVSIVRAPSQASRGFHGDGGGLGIPSPVHSLGPWCYEDRKPLGILIVSVCGLGRVGGINLPIFWHHTHTSPNKVKAMTTSHQSRCHRRRPCKRLPYKM
jgi:hypothetical protein